MFEKIKIIKSIGKRGDVNRYTLLLIVLLILTIVIIALYYVGTINLIKNLLLKKPR